MECYTIFTTRTQNCYSLGLLYLIFLLLISRHVIIHISACPLNGQDTIADGRDHV